MKLNSIIRFLAIAMTQFLVRISLVGERIEVDVFEDGHMEVSRFLGTEDILGGQELIYDIIDKTIFEDKAYEEKYRKK